MTVPNVTAKIPQDNETVASAIFWARAKYDFAVDGGAQGDISLFPDVAIPNGAVVLGAYINVLTVPTSGGAATVALKLQAAADVNAADLISGAPWSTTGWKAADLAVGSAPIQLTADRNLVATIGAADLTAGVFDVLIAYLPPGL